MTSKKEKLSQILIVVMLMFFIFSFMTISFRLNQANVESYLVACIPLAGAIMLRIFDFFNVRYSFISPVVLVLLTFGISGLYVGVFNHFAEPLEVESGDLIERWELRAKLDEKFSAEMKLTWGNVFWIIVCHGLLITGAWRTNKIRRTLEVALASLGILASVYTMSFREVVVASGFIAIVLAIRINVLSLIEEQRWQNEFIQSDKGFTMLRFVLYLRPFAIDSYAMRRRESLVDSIFATLKIISGFDSEEHVFAVEMEGGAPPDEVIRVVSLGKPNEELPSLGALRLKFSEDDWRPAVVRLIQKSSAVVLVPDGTDAIAWETAQLVKHVNPQQVFVWPQGRHSAYRAWKDMISDLLDVPFPCRTPYLLHFDSAWQPKVIDKPKGWITGLDRKAAIDLAALIRRSRFKQSIEVAGNE